MNDLAKRVRRLFPQASAVSDYRVTSDENGVRLEYWNTEKLGPPPTDSELLAVDLTIPTAEESELRAAIQILKNDVPDAWKTSTNAQQRVAWACKRLFVEVKQELKGGA